MTEQNICPPLASVHKGGYAHLHTYAEREGERERSLHSVAAFYIRNLAFDWPVSPANWFCIDYPTHSFLVTSGKPDLHGETMASSWKLRLRQFLWVCVQAIEPQLGSNLKS